jgi:hypothetical protein
MNLLAIAKVGKIRNMGKRADSPVGRVDIQILLPLIAALLLVLLAGCSGSHSTTADSDEDFFLPVDTAKGDLGVMGNAPPNIQLKEGLPEQVISDFDAPLTDEDVPIIYNLTPQAMRDSLSIINEQISYLQTILEASTIDPKMYYHSQVKAWRITNPVLRDSLFYALMAVDSSVQSEAGTDAEVLATETNDLIEVRFGTSVFKGISLKDAIDKTSDRFLYRKIVESGGYSKDIELRDTNFAIPTPLKPELLSTDQMGEKFLRTGTKAESRRGMFDISLYGLNFKIGSNWGAAIKIGNDEFGLPFWTAGTSSFLVSYKGMKIGFQLPVGFGKAGGNNFPLFSLRDRVLSGSRGLAGEFDIGMFGGSFSSSKITSSDLNTLTDPNNFYFYSQELMGYYSFSFSLNKMNFLRVKLGGASYQVQQAKLVSTPTEDKITDVRKDAFYSIYFKADYIYESNSERFGGSLQYMDLNLLASAWLDIIPHTVSLELKYSKIVSRQLRPWELPDFVVLSPRWFVEF